MSVPFVQPALAYASYSSYKKPISLPEWRRLDKADLWEDVEAGLESAPGEIIGQSGSSLLPILVVLEGVAT